MKSVEIDTLMIDKSMIYDVSKNERMLSMLTAIIRLGKDLITKGIERTSFSYNELGQIKTSLSTCTNT